MEKYGNNKSYVYRLPLEIFKQVIYFAVVDDSNVADLLTQFVDIKEFGVPVRLDTYSAPVAIKDVIKYSEEDIFNGHTLLINFDSGDDDLVHEVSHIVDFIFKTIGEDEPGTECRAYLNGYIYKELKHYFEIAKHSAKYKTDEED